MKRNLVMLWALVALIVALAAAPVHAGAYWKQIYARVNAQAGETLATGDVVTIKNADGLAYKADASDAALRPAVGVIGMGGTAGDTVEVVIFGVLGGQTALAESGAGFVSETPGAITQSSPAYSQQVGMAISATEYLVNCRNYFDTTGLVALGVLSGATPLVFEGATADAYETTVAVTDPTADRTITLPDATGAVNLNCTATHDYGGAAVDWTLSVAEAQCGFITVSNASGAVNALLPATIPGKTYTVLNDSGHVLTLKVTGETGGTIADKKWALYTTLTDDVAEVYELP